ncbi:DNA-binding transcriptional regulator, MerR family [Sphingobium sp. AP50]|uniref:MerR family transcriptional regulator n=1 Tax=Sphingobium sp. AP50 TaxID=1884369 RepID=UPI0008B1E3D3|nr:MerR family transcriptional regulator [Sphingobium sp. AP50]SEI69846.1 DNA-binding transcriptional regulator, MerR family [Sphingobium sp. AP50]
MTDLMDIAAVARLTGLTSRALRFYEGRGLVAPLRTASGRRLFGRDELARLHRIITLKRAGFSLSQIERLLNDRPVDLAPLLRAQIAVLDEQAQGLVQARAHLATALSRIDRGEPLDAATLCSLIRTGDIDMDQEKWKTVTDRYMSAQAEADFADAQGALPANFDQAAYGAQWADLTARIVEALPLDPASAQAGAFYDEWQALLAPFMAVATPAMTQGVTQLYDNIDEWQAEQTPPFSADVWAFIKAVGQARKAG